MVSGKRCFGGIVLELVRPCSNLAFVTHREIENGEKRCVFSWAISPMRFPAAVIPATIFRGKVVVLLGIVGAGGIGFYIINYIKFFEYGKAAVFMLVVLITVLVIDWVSVKIRDRYIMKAQHGQQIKTVKK